jgi:hypothetical protein
MFDMEINIENSQFYRHPTPHTDLATHVYLQMFLRVWNVYLQMFLWVCIVCVCNAWDTKSSILAVDVK